MLTNEQADKAADAVLAPGLTVRTTVPRRAFGKGTAIGALSGALLGAAFGYFLPEALMQAIAAGIGAGVLFGAYADGDVTKRGFSVFGIVMILIAWAAARG